MKNDDTLPVDENESHGIKVGLEQSKIPFLRPRNRNAIPMLRTKSFVVNPEVTYSIASGSIILTIGIIIGLSVPSVNFNEKFDFSRLENTINTPNPLEGMVVLLLQFFFGFALEGLQSGVNSNFGLQELLLPMVVGWFIGGLIAALIYDDKGKNGPYYSSIIAISVTLGISLVILVIVFIQTGEISNDVSKIFLPFFVILIITLAMAILSVPLIIVAYVGYTIGGKLNDE